MAWVELHIDQDDVTVTLGPDGKAVVAHDVTFSVSGGPLLGLDVRAVDADAVVLSGATLRSLGEDGQAWEPPTVSVRPGADETTLHIELPEGVRRGRYVVAFRYETDLRARGLMRTETPSVIVDWYGPRWDAGLPASQVTFRAPRRTVPLRANEPDDPSADAFGSVLATLKREANVDILTLTRPYAPKDQRVLWSVRADRSFLPEAETQGGARPLTGASRAQWTAPERTRSLAWCGAVLAAATLIFAVTLRHHREQSRLTAERGGELRYLIPMPLALRAMLPPVLGAVGLYLVETDSASWKGSSLWVLAAALLWVRPPVAKPELRGPGQWHEVSVEEAFRLARPIDLRLFDASCRAGKLSALGIFALALGAAYLELPSSPLTATVVALGVLLLWTPYAVSATRLSPPDLRVDLVGTLLEITRRVQKAKPETRVTPRVRVPVGSMDADELRVAFLPPRAVAGLLRVEVGASMAKTPFGSVILPEVLIRFEPGSACERALRAAIPYGKIATGHSPEEHVLSVLPRDPSATTAAELVLATLGAVGLAAPSADKVGLKTTASRRTSKVASSEPATAAQPQANSAKAEPSEDPRKALREAAKARARKAPVRADRRLRPTDQADVA